MRKPKSPAAFDDNKVQIQTTLDKWPYEDDVEGEPRDQKTERDWKTNKAKRGEAERWEEGSGWTEDVAYLAL